MSEVLSAHCPFRRDGLCRPNCMLLLTATEADVASGATDHGDGVCSFALMASHMASEQHSGGNYLMKMVAFDY